MKQSTARGADPQFMDCHQMNGVALRLYFTVIHKIICDFVIQFARHITELAGDDAQLFSKRVSLHEIKIIT